MNASHIVAFLFVEDSHIDSLIATYCQVPIEFKSHW
jgi:hypothetical protein